MNFQIEKINASSISFEEFEKKYLEKEKPVILSGVKSPNKIEWTKSRVKEKFLNKSYKEVGWYSYQLELNLVPGFPFGKPLAFSVPS